MSDADQQPSRLLRRAEAAKHIQNKWGYPCSPRTLAKYAVVGGGPAFRRAGRFPMYSDMDLDNWIISRLGPRITSTSGHPASRSPLKRSRNFPPQNTTARRSTAQNGEG